MRKISNLCKLQQFSFGNNKFILRVHNYNVSSTSDI